MFGKIVLLIEKGKISVLKLSGRSVKALQSFTWQDTQSLHAAISEIQKKYKKVTLLVHGDFVYSLSYEIEADIVNKATLKERVKPDIPDILDDTVWEFDAVKSDKKSKKHNVEVRVLVSKFYNQLTQALEDTKIRIQTVVPLSGKQSQSIQAALEDGILKSGIHLNLSNTHASTRSKKDLPVKEILTVVILVAVVVVGAWYFRSPDQPDTASEVFVEEEETPTPEPTPEFEKTDFTIAILNGSGIPGEAGDLENALLDEEYDVVRTGNADSYDYTSTEIQAKDSVPDEFIDLLDNDISRLYAVSTGDDLDDESDEDVIIVIGSDKNDEEDDSETNEEE